MTALARLALWCLRHAREPHELVERLGQWFDLLREVRRAPDGAAAIVLILRYILATNEPDKPEELVDGDRLRIKARGSGERRAKPHWIERELVVAVTRFADGVRKAAAQSRALGDLVATAHALHRALLQKDAAELTTRLREAAGDEPVLLRLSIDDGALQVVPWEALCEPGTAMGFLGNATHLLPVRDVNMPPEWRPRHVVGALKVLAIAPSGGASLASIELSLKDRIEAGEVEWLDPVIGETASPAGLSDQVRRAAPHVIHFLGHGGVSSDGLPAIRLADSEDGDAQWLTVELFSQDLQKLSPKPRLVVLEACEGAKPGAFASAAEIIARGGVDAVIAHLWPVKAEVAQRCSERFYRELAGQDRGAGDVARSLNEARRSLLKAFQGSAEAFVKPAPRVATQGDARAVDPALERLLHYRYGFSVVLGDRWKWDMPALDDFRGELRRRLERQRRKTPSNLPMSALTQRFALHCGADWLTTIPDLQQALRNATTYCLTPEQRRTYLLESEPDARNAYEACERSYGRTPFFVDAPAP